MARKKSATQPVSSSPATAPAAAKSRAAGSSTNVVTHKHKPTVPMAPEQPAPIQPPTHEQIALRAYLLAEARGFQGGSPEEDWFRAERELLAEF